MWCDAARFPHLFFLDARSIFPISIFLFHISLNTLYIAIVFTGVFFILMRMGYTPEASLRIIKRKMIGTCRNRSDNVIYRRRARW